MNTADKPECWTRPAVYELYERPLDGREIEALSFEAIDREAASHGFTPDQWEVVRRMIHTTADFSLIDSVKFTPDAVEHGIKALRSGSKLFVDSNMMRAGLSLARLREVYAEIGRAHV